MSRMWVNTVLRSISSSCKDALTGPHSWINIKRMKRMELQPDNIITSHYRRVSPNHKKAQIRLLLISNTLPSYLKYGLASRLTSLFYVNQRNGWNKYFWVFRDLLTCRFGLFALSVRETHLHFALGWMSDSSVCCMDKKKLLEYFLWDVMRAGGI